MSGGGAGARSVESEDLDIFDVEAIRRHRVFGKTMKFFVKWSGFSEEENTWEPERNLLGARALLKEYLVSQGVTSVAELSLKGKTSRKRAVEQVKPVSRTSRRTRSTPQKKDDSSTKTADEEAKTPTIRSFTESQLPDDWLERVVSIRGMRRDHSHTLWFSVFVPGDALPYYVSAAKMNVAHPQMVIRFYENSLWFRDGRSRKS
eukprot:TRINITY_DN26514_c0_g1_i1.p1 TRINITY_DN26514_c0_g1~~TRINITY_DN26514_c0_g1_i1.p1  ORF type:complete len:204 (-),score=31.78 TRINITY_DN26514_c0_g1_i1:75-686(-)